MTQQNPPRVATWLLKRFSCCDESLVGDLVEEYRHGRSQFWYWRQTSIAMFRSTASDIRSHPILALRAFLLLWVYLVCYMYCVLRPFQALYSDVAWRLDSHLLFSGLRFFAFLAYGFLPNVLAPCLGYATAGWVIARIHRPYGATFALANTLGFALGLAWTLEQRVMHANLVRGELYPLYLCFRFGMLLLFAGSLLMGSLWGATQPAQSVPEVLGRNEL